MTPYLTHSFARILSCFSSSIQNFSQNTFFKIGSANKRVSVGCPGIKTRWFSSSVSSQPDTEEKIEKVKFNFVMPVTGEVVEVEGKVGENVMEVGTRNDVGMEGACEGKLACTTCHVYVEDKVKALLPDPVEKEEDLLDLAPFLKENSRLGCQCILTKDFEGATFKLPAATINMQVDKPKK